MKDFEIEGLSLSYLNINSLLPKIDEIRFITKEPNTSIIEISESKLNTSTLNSELEIEDYDLIRLDRSSRGDEVACYIRKSLSYRHYHLNTIFFRNIESSFSKLFLA